MKIIVLGDGQWGKTIASLLKENKKNYEFWKPGSDLLDDSILINCLPANVIRDVLATHGKNLKNIIFINGSKGVEEQTHKLPYEIVTEILGKVDYFTLIGPGFAKEIMAKMPTLVNIGYVKEDNVELVKSLFETDYFRVKMVEGVKALELSSAFKNVYAIACGIASGLGFESNTQTKVILIAIDEFYSLAKALNIEVTEDMLPGTVGDLMLTCSSVNSRNFRFGKGLVSKNHLEVLKEIGETVEGYSTISSVAYFEKLSGVNLKLANFVAKSVIKDTDIKHEFLKLLRNI